MVLFFSLVALVVGHRNTRFAPLLQPRMRAVIARHVLRSAWTRHTRAWANALQYPWDRRANKSVLQILSHAVSSPRICVHRRDGELMVQARIVCLEAAMSESASVSDVRLVISVVSVCVCLCLS